MVEVHFLESSVFRVFFGISVSFVVRSRFCYVAAGNFSYDCYTLERDVYFCVGLDDWAAIAGGFRWLIEESRADFGRVIGACLERVLDFDRFLGDIGVGDFMFGAIGVLGAGFQGAALGQRLAAFGAGLL